jgi:Sporulation and spore germination
MLKRYAIAVLLLGAVFMLLCGAAFAQDQTPTQPEGETTSPETEAPSPGNVYFYLDGELAPAQRDITGGSQMAEFAMIELLKGPTEEEKTAGYVTYIPDGVKLQYSTIKQDHSEYSVNLSRELLELSGDSDAATKALAQIEKTLQEVTGIQVIGITVAAEGTGAQPEDAYALLGVAHETAGGETDSQDGGGSSNATILIIAIVAGLVMILILLFFIFYVPNRRAKASSQSSTPPEDAKKSKK